MKNPHAIVWAAALLFSASVPAAPPVAEVRNVQTTLHGVTVDDPYRWMEDVKSPDTQAWLKAQGDETRKVLDRIDGRDAIAKRLLELSVAQGDAVRGVTQMPGDRYYYLKRAAGKRQFSLLMRQGLSGAEQVLVDPEVAAGASGVPHAINYYRPSWDGRYLAYGMSAGGSEDASLYVLDIARGALVGKPVPRVHETPVHWLPGRPRSPVSRRSAA